MTMTKQTPALTRIPAATFILALAPTAMLWPVTANSAEFCVSCSGPFALYRCAVSKNGELTAPAGAQLTCIRDLARQGGHKQCAITKKYSDAECVGRLLVIAADPSTEIPPDHPINAEASPMTEAQDDSTAAAPVTTTPGDNLAESPANASSPNDNASVSEPAGEPKTVEELAKRTVQSSQKNIENAGQLVVDTAEKTGGHIKNAGRFVGTTAQTTWNCITSLFSDCSAKPDVVDPGTQPPPTASDPSQNADTATQ